MDSYYLDWANLLLRWLHVVTAIAWIGASLYFVMLDSSLEKPTDPESLDKGVGGEQWALHGGGFYNMQKYSLSPKKLPDNLHWSFWESYSTWISGFALFTVSYLANASTYLIDRTKMDWSPGAAIGVALAFFVVFWMAYDSICQLFGRRKHGDTIVGIGVALLVCFASWLACHWFAGRAAFILVGAMMATTMSGNVFFWIIPGQKKNVAKMRAGLPVDPIHGQRGKQRSVHNTYFTLPVIFTMLSNHYSFTYTHEYNWVVLILIMAGGAAIRQYFVIRHRYKLGLAKNPLPYALTGIAILIATIVWMRPAPQPAHAAAPAASAAPVGYAEIRPVLEQRCYSCHGAQVQMKNVRLDSPDAVKQHAQGIYQQAVATRVMPMNNATQMTDAERALLGRWFNGGAKTD
ncbi:MAG: urate hydroxylase PuuD [Burkholderiaceae bacterium]|nr:urate hydroxylase PuuD [Burkholderiaceae bacterium]